MQQSVPIIEKKESILHVHLYAEVVHDWKSHTWM